MKYKYYIYIYKYIIIFFISTTFVVYYYNLLTISGIYLYLGNKLIDSYYYILEYFILLYNIKPELVVKCLPSSMFFFQEITIIN